MAQNTHTTSLQTPSVSLVIVGHLAFNDDHTPRGTKRSNGGAGFYCAVGAAAAQRLIQPAAAAPIAGVVAAAGDDFDWPALYRLGVDIEGVSRYSNQSSARFIINQDASGSRTFRAEWGLAKDISLAPYPQAYRNARHVHLATAPPHQQLAWMQTIASWNEKPAVSVDTFEYFVRESPELTRLAIEAADMIFMNEEEADFLNFKAANWPAKTIILKRGSLGADLYVWADGQHHYFEAAAPRVEALDTTGAGDVLAGAFLTLTHGGLAASDALRLAVQYASSSVTMFGVEHLLTAGTPIKEKMASMQIQS